MSNTNSVFVYNGGLKKRIHLVDLSAWQKAGWSTDPSVNNQVANNQDSRKPSKSRRKSAENTVKEQIEREVE